VSGRIPEAPSQAEAEGIPDPGLSSIERTGTDGGMEPPHDTAVAVEEFGLTSAEHQEGEPLEGRLAREEPDVLSHADVDADESPNADTPFDQRAGQGVGRLVEPDEGVRADTEATLVATDAGTDLGGYSAEEAAMHLEPEV